jgi:hypothetical protein
MDIEYYITYDLVIPYRDIKIHPIRVKDFLLFSGYSACLTLEKNFIPDPKIISMTELEYIYYSTSQNESRTPYLFWFDRMLSLCLKDDNSFDDIEKSLERYDYDEDGKPFFIIGNKIYASEDFKEIKYILCQQNLIELPDTTISKEVRDSLEEARKYKEKLSGTKPGSFEDYIISLSSVTGWTLEYVYSMPIRKFIKTIRRFDNLIHYKIYLAASMSGMVEFKDKSFIKHWLVDFEENDKYADVSVDLGVMQKKISLEGAKK